MSTSYDPRITAYFGDAVLQAGFVAVPHLLLRHYHRLGLSANQAMFVLQLMESTWDLAEPPRTTGELAQRMGVDKRTIRRYSEEVAELGLLMLFDQFDEHGAQIGNGYDLNPLFARLAALVPPGERDRVPRRTPRPIRARSAPDNVVPGPGQSCPPRPRSIMSAPAPVNHVRPGEDHPIRERGMGRSRLNGIKRIPNKQQEPLIVAAAERATTVPVNAVGYSLGLGVALSEGEVALSHELLALMGIEQPVRGILAPALAPAEVWSLRAYALAKRWNTGLAIAQVYDRATRSAKAAEDVPPALAALGCALAELPPMDAEAVLACLVDGPGPGPPVLTDVSPTVQDAARAAWPLLERLAAQRSPFRSQQRHARTRDGDGDGTVSSELWTRVQDMLSERVPADEFETWLKPARLLALGDSVATVGAGNTFAREHVDACYRVVLEDALRGVLGREVCVEIVIA